MRQPPPPHLALRAPRFVLLAGLWAAGACSPATPQDIDAAMADPDSPSVELADLVVTIDYAGTQQGALVIAAFSSFPPSGPPSAFQTVSDPTFPAMVTLRDLETGTYHILGVLDLAPASPTQPGAEDLQTASGPMEMTGANTSVSLTLVDP